MNENISKIWMKIREIEITIEGTSDFVSKQYQEIIKGTKPKKNETTHSNSNLKQKAKSSKTSGKIKKKVWDF